MGAALENYRKRFCERQAKAASDAENRAIRADLLTELRQRWTSSSTSGGRWKSGGMVPTGRRSGPRGVKRSSHFSAGVDPATGEVRPMPQLTLCDGTIVTDLDQARRGLVRAEAKLQGIAEAETALTAALQRIGEFKAMLRELDTEIAGANPAATPAA